MEIISWNRSSNLSILLGYLGRITPVERNYCYRYHRFKQGDIGYPIIYPGWILFPEITLLLKIPFYLNFEDT